jgi:hypothetical protein
MRRQLVDADHRIGARGDGQIDGFPDVHCPTQWRCRQQNHHPVRRVLLLVAKPRQRVLHDRKMRGIVGGERCRPHERHVATARSCDRRRLLVVGRENHAIEHARFERRIDRVHNERLPAEEVRILPRYSFRSRSGGDDPQDSHEGSA